MEKHIALTWNAEPQKFGVEFKNALTLDAVNAEKEDDDE